jgi:hypothetical protein
MILKALSTDQIEKFAGRKGVKRTAVENFLGTIVGSRSTDARRNLQTDARVYKWNAPTVNAISAGISLASR